MNEIENPPDLSPRKQPPEHREYPPPNEAFMVLVVAFVAAMIGGVSLVKLGKLGLFSSELLFLLPPLIYLQVKGYNISRCLRWNRVSASVIFSTVLIGLALIVLLDEVDRLITMIYPMPEELQQVLQEFFKLDTWADFLVVGVGIVLVAAICEESLFRGFLQVSFEAYGNITRAVLLGALLFSLAHFNPWWMIQILVLGVLLGFISWRSNSTIPSILVHGMNNGLALLTGGALEGEKWAWYNTGDHVSPTVLVAAAALLFMGLKHFLRITEETFANEEMSTHEPTAT